MMMYVKQKQASTYIEQKPLYLTFKQHYDRHNQTVYHSHILSNKAVKVLSNLTLSWTLWVMDAHTAFVWIDHCSLEEISHHNQKSCEWISHSADNDNSTITIWITDYVPVFVLHILLIYSTLSRITPGNMMGFLINNWLSDSSLFSFSYSR